MDIVINACFVPLEACHYGLELLYSVPFATPLIIALALLPIAWIGQATQLVCQYPFFAVALSLLFLVVAAMGWLFFGTLLAALAQTAWWLTWYAPLWLGVGRLLWILFRRYVLDRLGWRRRLESAVAAARNAVHARLMQMSFNHLFSRANV